MAMKMTVVTKTALAIMAAPLQTLDLHGNT
jgi:hypothetical protein